ncbi:hypothetical protein ENUP19_0367G0010 [Entamoeba nuttalli]|uniref:Transmembrane protein n=2 Tax=Entamoeba nuttalli TaxID=412467 RepID=K2GFS8_ENTNP|nr:hypothetical protein ENU1_051470 [Entamoeba nuttalli P19]EKE41561.1 hypothetical protein ENU1_051470 [Entamoeba nuttalli P19]|eukprot:XP_008856103.1 hypothetical protein ENU1_051470 [Entamoeba nuttalli P19]
MNVSENNFNISQLIQNVTLHNSQGYKHVSIISLLKGKFEIILNIFKREIKSFLMIDYSHPSFKSDMDDLLNVIFICMIMVFSIGSIFILLLTLGCSKDKKFIKSFLMVIEYCCIIIIGFVGMINQLYTPQKFEEVYLSFFIFLMIIVLFIRLLISIPFSLNIPTLFYPIIYIFWLDNEKLTSFKPLQFAFGYSVFIQFFASIFSGLIYQLPYMLVELFSLPLFYFISQNKSYWSINAVLSVLLLLETSAHIFTLLRPKQRTIKLKKD